MMDMKYKVVEHPQVPGLYIIKNMESGMYVGVGSTNKRELQRWCYVKNTEYQTGEASYWNYLRE